MNSQSQKLPVSTPKQTKALQSVILNYKDGESLTLEVPNEQGFHRIEHYKKGDTELTIHEVFITEAFKEAS